MHAPKSDPANLENIVYKKNLEHNPIKITLPQVNKVKEWKPIKKSVIKVHFLILIVSFSIIYLSTIGIKTVKFNDLFNESKNLNKILNDEFKFPKPESLKSSYKAQKAVPDDIDNKVFEIWF